MSVFKTFPIHEGYDLDFRAEVYNLANTTNFAIPNGLFGSTPFGKITSTSAIYTPRQFQFALKLKF